MLIKKIYHLISNLSHSLIPYLSPHTYTLRKKYVIFYSKIFVHPIFLKNWRNCIQDDTNVLNICLLSEIAEWKFTTMRRVGGYFMIDNKSTDQSRAFTNKIEFKNVSEINRFGFENSLQDFRWMLFSHIFLVKYVV